MQHLKYAEQWAAQYPDARKYACPGLPARMPQVPWTHELGGAAPPADWGGGVDCVHFDCETNPATGRPFFNEVVFHHRASRSLFCADLFWNYPAGPLPNHFGETGTGSVHQCPKAPAGSATVLPAVPVPWGTSAWKFGMDRVYAPFYRAAMVGPERRARYRAAAARVLAWEVDAIVPCHGDVIRGADLCRRVLREHLLPGE